MAPKKTASKKQNPIKKGIAIVLTLTAIIALVFLLMNSGNIAKTAIEKMASDALGVPVRIAKLDISLQDKQIDVTGLKIANPPGYQNPYAMTVDMISISASDLSRSLLVFNEIGVSGTAINLEVNEKGTNLKDLRDHAKKTAPSEKNKAEQVKVIIRDLNIKSAQVNPRVTLVKNTLDPVNLPDIHISGIGEKTNGALVSEAAVQILDYIVQVATKESIQAGYLKGMMPEKLSDLQKSMGIEMPASGLMDKVKGLFGN